jgi:hypothetical protein
MAAKSVPVVGQEFHGDDPAVVKAVKMRLGGSTETADVVATEVTTAQTLALFSLAAGVRVLDMTKQNLTAWFALVDIAVGDGDDNSLWFATTALGATASAAVPTKSTAAGKVYAAADTIDAFILGTHADGSDLETGLTEFVLFYIENLDN